MFECSACTLRCIRAGAGESFPRGASRRLLLSPRLSRRRISSDNFTVGTALESIDGDTFGPKIWRRYKGEPFGEARIQYHSAEKGNPAVANRLPQHEPVRYHHTGADDGSSGAAPPDAFAKDERYLNAAQLRHHVAAQDKEMAPQRKLDEERRKTKALEKELQWLTDPLKFSDHVNYTLRCGQEAKALELCRMASRDRDCVVAWNHLINHSMKVGRINEAMKFYNEMKKRAHFPDSYTYLLLLRGLLGVQPEDKKKVVRADRVAKAVSIYHSMNSPTSRVKPSIIHTNAALQVCAFGHDMDSFWGIAGKLPTRGSGAPDTVTYFIILNAIRHDALSTSEELEGERAASKKDKAVNEGRRIWAEIIQSWRAGEIMIDEQLVGAMARLLLISERIGDWDDVLNLVRQTMQIERMAAPVGSEERSSEHVPQVTSPSSTTLSKGEVETEDAALSAEEMEVQGGWIDTPAAKTFKPVHPLPRDGDHPHRPTNLAFVTPGNDTLSFIIEACARMRAPKTAMKYWELFNKDYWVKPDVHNFHSLLRVLGKSRASARAAQLVSKDLKNSGVKPMNLTFRLAMEVCQRDWKNLHALENATAIIDVLEDTQADPDVMTLKKYISLALQSDSGPKITASLDRLDRLVHSLRSRLLYGPASGKTVNRTKFEAEKEEITSFFRTLVGAIDTLMNRALVPRETFKEWHARRSQLNSFIGRLSGAMDSVEGSRGGKGRFVHPLEEKQLQLESKWDRSKKFHVDQEALKKFKFRERREVPRRRAGPRIKKHTAGGADFADSPGELGM